MVYVRARCGFGDWTCGSGVLEGVGRVEFHGRGMIPWPTILHVVDKTLSDAKNGRTQRGFVFYIMLLSEYMSSH